jgi:hypothetical protein
MALDIAQSISLNSNAKLNSSPQEENGIGSPNQGGLLAKDSKATPVDTVSISSRSQQTKTASKKEEATIVSSSDKSGRIAAKVDFVYDLKGELITKYLDTANRLVYQIPSELMLRLKEAEAKSDSSVDTKV